MTSPYGLPQSDPSDGETMVYNSSTDAFEAGYVTSSGQVSTFNLVSTHAQPLPAGVVTVIDFGATSVQTVTQTMTAGWSMGGDNINATNKFNAAPTTTGSTYTVTMECEIFAQTGQAGLLSTSGGSGYFTQVAGSVAIVGTGSYQSVTFTDTDNTVSIWQLTNSLSFSYLNFGANSATIRNMEITITMNHA